MPERDGEGRNPCSNVTGGSWETKITSFLPNQSGRYTNSLTGSDVVGAAKTGSGKTLAFLIPLLECLWRQRWSRMVDGLGALIISPTRELAFQAFQVLNKIGAHHQFSVVVLNFRIVRHSFAEPVFYLDNTTFVKPEWKMY